MNSTRVGWETADFELLVLSTGQVRFTAVQMQQSAREQRPLLLFPGTIFVFFPLSPALARARSLSPAPESPDIPLLKLSSGEPAARGWHSNIIRPVKGFWFFGCWVFFSALLSQSDLNCTPAAICEISQAQAGRDGNEERSDKTVMSGGECGPAAPIPLVPQDIVNRASQFIAQRE